MGALFVNWRDVGRPFSPESEVKSVGSPPTPSVVGFGIGGSNPLNPGFEADNEGRPLTTGVAIEIVGSPLSPGAELRSVGSPLSPSVVGLGSSPLNPGSEAEMDGSPATPDSEVGTFTKPLNPGDGIERVGAPLRSAREDAIVGGALIPAREVGTEDNESDPGIAGNEELGSCAVGIVMLSRLADNPLRVGTDRSLVPVSRLELRSSVVVGTIPVTIVEKLVMTVTIPPCTAVSTRKTKRLPATVSVSVMISVVPPIKDVTGTAVMIAPEGSGAVGLPISSMAGMDSEPVRV